MAEPGNRLVDILSMPTPTALTEALSSGSEDAQLDAVIKEMGRECDVLAQKGRYHTTTDASRRVVSLSKLGTLLLQKKQASMTADALDPESPAVRIFVKIIMERVKRCVQEDMHFDSEQMQTFMHVLPTRMDGWEEEVRRKIKQQLFQMPDTSGGSRAATGE